jgi:hypothetical protein
VLQCFRKEKRLNVKKTELRDSKNERISNTFLGIIRFPIKSNFQATMKTLVFYIGLVFDFVFDFKARGQWKHWNDIVKNSEIPEKLSPHALIPTVDTAR